MLSLYEQETIISFSEADSQAEIYTASKRVASHLLKAGLTPTKQDPNGWWFTVPKAAVRIKAGRHTARIGGCKMPSKVSGFPKNATCRGC